MRKMVLIVAVLLASSIFAGETLPAASKELPVMAWGGVPADKASVARYRELADAGFTINFCGFANIPATLQGLDLAQQAGVKLLVSLSELQSDPERCAAQLKSHPALMGYFLRDEPDTSLFPELAGWTRRIHSVDDAHLTYINLLPTYATTDQLKAKSYQEYVDRYMAEVPVKMLSFDHYPVIQGAQAPELRGDWYGNLECISTAARKANVPFWAFALSTKHFSYPTATVPQLRCQIFSDLAYGAQGLQYFTYWQVTGSSEGMFSDAPIQADGQRTPVYDRVKQVNGEAKKLWPVFSGAKVLSIEHAGKTVPAGTHSFTARPPIKSLDAASLIVTHLQNGDREYLVLVNRDINNACAVNLEFDRDGVQRVTPDAMLEPVLDRASNWKLEPGNVAIFSWRAR